MQTSQGFLSGHNWHFMPDESWVLKKVGGHPWPLSFSVGSNPLPPPSAVLTIEKFSRRCQIPSDEGGITPQVEDSWNYWKVMKPPSPVPSHSIGNNFVKTTSSLVESYFQCSASLSPCEHFTGWDVYQNPPLMKCLGRLVGWQSMKAERRITLANDSGPPPSPRICGAQGSQEVEVS